MCTPKYESVGLFLRMVGGAGPPWFSWLLSRAQLDWLEAEIEDGSRVGKGESGCLNVISEYFCTIFWHLPTVNQQNLDVVPEVKGGVGQEKQGTKAMWLDLHQPLRLVIAEVNLNISFYSLSLYWVLLVVCVFAACRILKAPHRDDQLGETKRYRDVCPFEMQITLRKEIKIATAFVKIRGLSPCSSEPHLSPFAHSSHSNRGNWQEERRTCRLKCIPRTLSMLQGRNSS